MADEQLNLKKTEVKTPSKVPKLPVLGLRDMLIQNGKVGDHVGHNIVLPVVDKKKDSYEKEDDPAHNEPAGTGSGTHAPEPLPSRKRKCDSEAMQLVEMYRSEILYLRKQRAIDAQMMNNSPPSGRFVSFAEPDGRYNSPPLPRCDPRLMPNYDPSFLGDPRGNASSTVTSNSSETDPAVDPFFCPEDNVDDSESNDLLDWEDPMDTDTSVKEGSEDIPPLVMVMRVRTTRLLSMQIMKCPRQLILLKKLSMPC